MSNSPATQVNNGSQNKTTTATRKTTVSAPQRQTTTATRKTTVSPGRNSTPASDRTTSTARRVTVIPNGGGDSGKTASGQSGTDKSTVTRPATVVRNDRPTSERPAPQTSGQNGNRTDGGSHGGVNPAPPADNHGQQPPRDNFRPQHPRERDYIDFDRRPPHHFYDPHHAHCFGYRVRALPAGYWYRDWHGIRYYCYNDVYYRLIDGCYIVCRPPFGTSIAAAVVADITWTAVKISYYNTLNNTYDKIDENNAYIAKQNEQIARNNALIEQQNATLAAQAQYMATRSSEAYQLAQAMGLVQSYAAAGTDYFYQDGVFYRNSKDQYLVIIPPAGALVDSLPEDYDIFTFNGQEYYQVENTVYRVTVVSGKACFEVLGQRY